MILARSGLIDPTANLKRARVWLFTGKRDQTVDATVVQALGALLREAMSPAGAIAYVNDVDAGHAMVTSDYGREAARHRRAFHQRLPLRRRGQAAGTHLRAVAAGGGAETGPGTRVRPKPSFTCAAPYTASLADTGYAYVPPRACKTARCRVHVAFHGCKQSAEAVGDKFVRHAGYNRWADSNAIIVLYPQTITCYGFGAGRSTLRVQPEWLLEPAWGYTGAEYHTHNGAQCARCRQCSTGSHSRADTDAGSRRWIAPGAPRVRVGGRVFWFFSSWGSTDSAAHRSPGHFRVGLRAASPCRLERRSTPICLCAALCRFCLGPAAKQPGSQHRYRCRARPWIGRRRAGGVERASLCLPQLAHDRLLAAEFPRLGTEPGLAGCMGSRSRPWRWWRRRSGDGGDSLPRTGRASRSRISIALALLARGVSAMAQLAAIARRRLIGCEAASGGSSREVVPGTRRVRASARLGRWAWDLAVFAAAGFYPFPLLRGCPTTMRCWPWSTASTAPVHSCSGVATRIASSAARRQWYRRAGSATVTFWPGMERRRLCQGRCSQLCGLSRNGGDAAGTERDPGRTAMPGRHLSSGIPAGRGRAALLGELAPSSHGARAGPQRGQRSRRGDPAGRLVRSDPGSPRSTRVATGRWPWRPLARLDVLENTGADSGRGAGRGRR